MGEKKENFKGFVRLGKPKSESWRPIIARLIFCVMEIRNKLRIRPGNIEGHDDIPKLLYDSRKG